MLDVIKKYLSAGLSIIPVRADKRPLIDWKPYQTAQATEAQADVWSLPIACIGGAVSGGITCIDFDDRGSAFGEWMKRLNEIKPELMVNFYIQSTPSGGWHVVFRSDMHIENRKLAQKRVNDKIVGLIETRGEGGYFLIAPSNRYVQKEGDITTLQKISNDDAETLLLISESFNEVAEEQKKEPPKITTSGVTPFDDYDSKNNPVELLRSHGWAIIGNRTDRVMLCRPDKKGGLSATWNHIPNRFYVFSTSTQFETGHVYKASAVYTILEHGGDFVASAKKLYADGYGTRMKPVKPIDFDTTPKTGAVKISQYREDIYGFYKKTRRRGLELGLQKFDDLLRFDRGYLNVVTGIPTHGKSEVVDFISVLLAKRHNWKIVYFSPENYPLEIHFNKLAEKYCDALMFGQDKNVIDIAIEFIDEHYRFINATEDDLSIENILSACENTDIKPDCLIIDPWNEIEHAARPQGMNETEFTGTCLRKLRKYARKNNICLFIVVHPTKMHKEKGSTTYPVPTLYDISGSSNWYNKADNGIVVYRNFENDTTDIYVKKVKFKNYGELGAVTFVYNKESGNYVEKDTIPDNPF